MNKKKNGFAATGILYTILLIFLALMTTLLVTLSSRSKVLEKLKQNAKEEVGIDTLGIPSKDYARGDIVSYLGYNWKVIDDNGASSKLILNRYLTQSELKDNLPDDVNDSIISSNTVPMCLSTSSSKYCNGDSIAYTWNTSIVKPIVQNWINYEMEENGLNIEKELVEMSFNDGVETINDYIKIPNYNETIYSKTVDGGTQTAVYGGETVTFDAINGCLYSLLPANVMSNSLVASLDRKSNMTYIVFPTNNTGGSYCLDNPPQRYVCDGSQIVPIITVKENYYTKSDKIIFAVSFNFAGDVQTFTVPYTGTYKLEVWGAQGGSYNDDCIGGKGGYSSGLVELKKGTKLYIVVGGAGNGNGTHTLQNGGFNGGGEAFSDSDGNTRQSSGGGATHIATVNGKLASLENNKDSILIVAGGGGGSAANAAIMCTTGGAGGGLSGLSGQKYDESSTIWGIGYGGNQNSGGDYTVGSGLESTYFATGKFGLGASSRYAGGGGGYYGGGVGVSSSGGGSSYIDSLISANTINGNNIMPTHDGSSTMTGNSGHGYAKVTFLD